MYSAEYAAVPYQTMVKIPTGVTFTEAAGLSQSILDIKRTLLLPVYMPSSGGFSDSIPSFNLEWSSEG